MFDILKENYPYKVMSGILSELNNGHIRTFPTGKENTGIGWLN